MTTGPESLVRPAGQPEQQVSQRLALIVEDEDVLARMVSLYLANAGWRTLICDSGEESIELVRAHHPGVVLMDLTLHGAMDGIEACRRIREFSDAVIVVMSARTNETDLRVGLAAGADDYVTKPFSARELVTRLRAMVDEPSVAQDGAPVRRFGALELDLAHHEARLHGERQPLTRTEFDLLRLLSSEPSRTFTADELGTVVFGTRWRGDADVIAGHLGHIRRVLGDNVSEARFVVSPEPNLWRMGTGELGQAS